MPKSTLLKHLASSRVLFYEDEPCRFLSLKFCVWSSGNPICSFISTVSSIIGDTLRQFTGFVSDTDVGVEAAALYSSIAGSRWASAIDKSRKAYSTSPYTVAQYNSPFEYTDRVNEIWMLFDEEDSSSS
ncbi:hypothetical protein M5K25_026594 [Dendrobium thyrsiflorum]|uniref:Uncharacterized protein n=1 Tax=Dendrobium thyrsiflorum TaxID=117978 RepID=A0ABD0TXS5_DENTH